MCIQNTVIIMIISIADFNTVNDQITMLIATTIIILIIAVLSGDCSHGHASLSKSFRATMSGKANIISMDMLQIGWFS